MWVNDVHMVLVWWGMLFLVGASAYPIAHMLFSRWFDGGYSFAKAIGFAAISFLIYVSGTLHIAPFSTVTVYVTMALVFLLPTVALLWNRLGFGMVKRKKYSETYTHHSLIIIAEELFFLGCLVFWAWIKAHEPSIRGLEKFMDYGFMQTILNSRYFPAPDIWWAGGTINYYYFGHLVTAVLTRASGLPLSVTFNLMLSTLFALCATMSWAIGKELFIRNRIGKDDRVGVWTLGKRISIDIGSTLVGVATAWFVTLAGNMQTIYAFTKGYTGDEVVPFWTVLWKPAELTVRLMEGIERYWYANATRFIPFTIHEFPAYSFVVSDIHGHVLSIPFALLAIALIIELFSKKKDIDDLEELGLGDDGLRGIVRNPKMKYIVFFGFLTAILLMTNAFDGPIYALLFAAVIAVLYFAPRAQSHDWLVYVQSIIPLGVIGVVAAVTALPFLTHFSSFATGIGVNCPLVGFENSTFGPFIFEGAEKCQKSPLWMMWLLWGFFWFSGAALFIRRISYRMNDSVRRLLQVLYWYGIFLIIIPEFFYAKDIYPAHFRSNTMFKLGYQAFMMWSIVAVQSVASVIVSKKQNEKKHIHQEHTTHGCISRVLSVIPTLWIRRIFLLILIHQIFLVSIFPIFAVRSYFGQLRTYVSIDGLGWFKNEYPDDYMAMVWLRDTVIPSYRWDGKNPAYQLPVIVEADGESYTDNNRISAFAGTPTIVGWAVHEWLWRGSYEIVAPPREDVRQIYESGDVEIIRSIAAKYNVRYIIVGMAEREKFKNLQEDVIQSISTVAFRHGGTVIYSIESSVPEFVRDDK